MQPKRPQRRILPKISTMPRQASEAAHYLDIYKLTIEKKRLTQEMIDLDQRRQIIAQRLVEIEANIASLEDSAHDLRQPATPPPTLEDGLPNSQIFLPHQPSTPYPTPASEVDTLFLDY